MQGNPLSCNCYLAWFAGWLRKQDIAGITGRCHDPPRLKDAIIKDIPHHEFKCNSAFNALLYNWFWSPVAPVDISYSRNLYHCVLWSIAMNSKWSTNMTYPMKLIAALHANWFPRVQNRNQYNTLIKFEFANNACFVPSSYMSSAHSRKKNFTNKSVAIAACLYSLRQNNIRNLNCKSC